MPPMVGAYERPLSFTTMISRRLLSSEMLLSASQVMPPVSAPSPTTAMTCLSSWPVIWKAREMPSAQLRELEACELSTMSWTDSARCGYPARPLVLRRREKSWRPVRSLCT